MKRQLKIAETYVKKKQITEIERRPKMFHQRQSVKNTGTNSVWVCENMEGVAEWMWVIFA